MRFLQHAEVPARDIEALNLAAHTPFPAKHRVAVALDVRLVFLHATRRGRTEERHVAAQETTVPIVLEGEFPEAQREAVRRLTSERNSSLVELTNRQQLRFDKALITGTNQGVWPGIRAEHPTDNTLKSAPSGNPWIDTNTGFLRFGRSAASGTFWIANQPPLKTVITGERLAFS